MSRFYSGFAWSIALTMVGVALGGCMAPQGSDDTGQVSFFVKDAPADEFSSVFVTFSEVEVHRSGAGDDEDDDNESASPTPANETEDGNETVDDGNETDESAAGWFTIVNSTQTVDLKAFQGDARAFLGSEEIPVGTYTQIRIHVDEAYGMMNGTRVNFTVPSSTLKIVRPWTVEANETTELTVDFLLDKSIHKAGDKYMLKPVLKLSISGPSEDEAEDDDANPGQGKGKQGQAGQGSQGNHSSDNPGQSGSHRPLATDLRA